MADIKRISNKNTITNGTEETNLSLSDILLTQHVSGDNSDYQVTFAQAQAVPYGVCNSASGENKTVTFSNYPSDFTAQVGTKILVKFTNKNTLGSVSAGTYPTLTAGGVTKPILAKGKTVASGVPFANQIAELTLTPDGWNIDQDAREVTTSYQINADGTNSYNVSQVNGALANYTTLETVSPIENNRVTDINNAVCLVGNIFYDKTFYAGYTALNLPTINDGNWRIEFKSKYLSGGYTQAIQIAYNTPTGNTPQKLYPKMYIRHVWYDRTTSTYTFGDWQKYITESDVNSTLADYPKCKIVSLGTVSINQGTSVYTISDALLTYMPQGATIKYVDLWSAFDNIFTQWNPQGDRSSQNKNTYCFNVNNLRSSSVSGTFNITIWY